MTDLTTNLGGSFWKKCIFPHPKKIALSQTPSRWQPGEWLLKNLWLLCCAFLVRGGLFALWPDFARNVRSWVSLPTLASFSS